MTLASDSHAPAGRLSLALVLDVGEEECTVFADEQRLVLPFAEPFPRPRIERVAPGHLVAVAIVTDGPALIVWRWFDAVVLDQMDGSVALWEPIHGRVNAAPRDPRRNYLPGTRAYLSAGLPGADWWVAGSVVERATNAEVELKEVERFFDELGLWAESGQHVAG